MSAANLPFELDRNTVLQLNCPSCSMRIDRVGCVAKLNRALDQPAIATAIRKANGIGAHLWPPELTAMLPPPATHLEDVGKVAPDAQLQPIVDRPDEKIRESYALDERVLENELALKKDRVLRIPGVATERVIGHREIDLR